MSCSSVSLLSLSRCLPFVLPPFLLSFIRSFLLSFVCLVGRLRSSFISHRCGTGRGKGKVHQVLVFLSFVSFLARVLVCLVNFIYHRSSSKYVRRPYPKRGRNAAPGIREIHRNLNCTSRMCAGSTLAKLALMLPDANGRWDHVWGEQRAGDGGAHRSQAPILVFGGLGACVVASSLFDLSVESSLFCIRLSHLCHPTLPECTEARPDRPQSC